MAIRLWLSASGLAFVVLFIGAMLLLGDQLGSVGDHDDQFISYYEEGANRARDIAGAAVLAAAALAFATFGSLAYALLRERGTAQPLALVAFAAALLLAGMLLASAAALSSVATSIAVSDIFDERPHEFGPDVSRLTTQLGYMGLVFAMWASALCIATFSLAARSAGIFPAWLVGFGLVAAFALLFSFLFMPAIVLPLWVLAASITMLRSQPPAAHS